MLSLGACGPITSTSSISSARYALELADNVQAETLATYEYVSAVEYLDKAREEWSSSDYQSAEEYAERARQFAVVAYERAVGDPERTIEEEPDAR